MAQVLDKGWFELEDFMGSDQKIVKRARVSNVQPSLRPIEERTLEQDRGLINYLIKHRHGSPFEGVIFEFYVKCPLFVRSEWHRHRMASYNEMSGRYVQYEAEFYLPDEYRIPGLTNKQGSRIPPDEWTFKSNDYLTLTKDQWNEQINIWMEESVNAAFTTYEGLLAFGVAKEMARMVLPPNLYTAFYMTVNARSAMNFLSLRNADNAQWEIRQFAIVMESIFEEKLPLTYAAWRDNGRDAP